jgi:dolichol-phosphate mannosyltransferase
MNNINTLLVIIPTYNEIENIVPLVGEVFSRVPTAHILVVDDNSPDGTAAAVEKIAGNNSALHILKRSGKQGLASAYIDGFKWGIPKGYDVFLEMDADFSHNPEYIPEMLEQIKTYDVVIGSRNIKGGGVEGWSVIRNMISKGGSLYSRIVLSCPIMDLTGGFNMWRKSALDKIGLDGIISKGYSFQVEMKFKAYHYGCTVKEIPILFPDRKHGSSKMSKKIFIEALINIWKIKKNTGVSNAIEQFFKFAVTGVLGAVTNLFIFYLCVDLAKMQEIPVSIGCFMIAVTQNYIINHKWSFRQKNYAEKLSFKKWLLFICGSLLGLAINIMVMSFIIKNFNLPWKFIAQACGIAAGMVFNFTVSKLVIFKRRKNVN